MSDAVNDDQEQEQEEYLDIEEEEEARIDEYHKKLERIIPDQQQRKELTPRPGTIYTNPNKVKKSKLRRNEPALSAMNFLADYSTAISPFDYNSVLPNYHWSCKVSQHYFIFSSSVIPFYFFY